MKGIIYKIVCNTTGDTYYGSTIMSLAQRMTSHKAVFKKWKQGLTTCTSSFPIIEKGNYSVSIVDTVEFENKSELLLKEREYIRNNVCVNKYMPILTNDEKKHGT